MVQEIMSETMLRRAGVLAEDEKLDNSADYRDRLAQAGRNAAARLTRPGGPAAPLPMNKAQEGLVYRLLGQLRTHNPEVERTARSWFEDHLGSMTKPQASEVIDRLRAQLARPAVDPNPTTALDMSTFQRVLAGLHEPIPAHPDKGVTLHRYALRQEDGGVRFYILKESKRGKRYLVIQHGDDTSMLKIENGALNVARRIAEDPKAAMLLYGTELGKCGHCGRTLTNDESRALGIGPICRGKMGW